MKFYLNNLIIIVLSLLLSGCSVFESSSALLAPPELPGQKAELKKALSKYIPDNAKLLTPLNSEQHNNPILLVDLDDDHLEEAVVFYKSRQKPSLAEGVILKKKDGEWEKIADISGEGTVLHDLQLADFNGDGKKEIIAGFAYSEEAEDKGLLVFDLFSKKEPVLLLNEAYSYFLVDQFSDTNEVELVLINHNREQSNTISLYHFAQGQLKPLDQLELDPFINGYYKIQSGYISPNQKGLMFDVGVGAHSAATFVISVNEGRLFNVFPHIDLATFKASTSESKDTNGDGILEYAILEEPYMDEPLAYVDTPYITTYYQLNHDSEPEAIARNYINYQYRYRLNLPFEWGKVKIIVSHNEHQVEIIQAETDEVLFDIHITDKVTLPVDNWVKLGETSSYNYWTKTKDRSRWNLFEIIQK
ncbi:hypothetical protein ACA30_17335 [Virgibacillus soli]|uniref:VCBS repeat-containing protein n=1 Tax=Lederbergia galactosidilytica TaxID=217031 RepID=A0A0Q9Y720_9BACI|nr:hypothetical protein ACA29_13190 [Lederbergia galactosidilytica]KRG12959.1 hypothetical protein ACA30_17335 [Virgibacillus soli]